MRDGAHDSESGQGLVEYALILAGIAVVAAVIYLSGAINGLVGLTSNFPNGFNNPATTKPMTPPIQPPTTVRQCRYGGWRNYPQFADEASCVKFVTRGS